MPKTVTLHCYAGNHDWQRVSQRGRRPFACPDCIAAGKTIVMPDKDNRVEVKDTPKVVAPVIDPKVVETARAFADDAQSKHAAATALEASTFAKVDKLEAVKGGDAYDRAYEAWNIASKAADRTYLTLQNAITRVRVVETGADSPAKLYTASKPAPARTKVEEDFVEMTPAQAVVAAS